MKWGPSLLWRLFFLIKVRMCCDFRDKSTPMILSFRHQVHIVWLIFFWQKCACVTIFMTIIVLWGFLLFQTSVVFGSPTCTIYNSLPTKNSAQRPFQLLRRQKGFMKSSKSALVNFSTKFLFFLRWLLLIFLVQVCFDEMVPPTRIFQCSNGHHICETCKWVH